MKKTGWMLLMMVAALTLALAGCGTKDGASSGSSSSEDGKKIYKVGTEATFAPFESVDDSGKLWGLMSMF